MLYSAHNTQFAHDIHANRLTLGALAFVIASVSVALVLLTHYITANPQSLPLEWQWNLRWEHNFAAWWSGSLLALTAILTLDNALDAPNANVRKAWITLGLIILFLALDEIGSLHERMGLISLALGAGRWAIAIPLALVIAYLCIRSGFTLLFQGGRERIQIIMIGVGFTVLLSVAFQEYLEHAIDWRGSAWKPWRAAIEEGSELVGIMIVLVAVSLPLWDDARQALRSLSAYARPITVGALILLLPLFAISLDLDRSKGDPSDWLASALFLGAGLAWARRAWTSGPWLGALILAAMATFAALASVAMGATESFTIAGIEVHRRALVYALLGGSVLAFSGRWHGLALLAGAALLALSQLPLAIHSPNWPYLLGPICGLAAFIPAAFAASGSALAQNGISSSRSS